MRIVLSVSKNPDKLYDFANLGTEFQRVREVKSIRGARQAAHRWGKIKGRAVVHVQVYHGDSIYGLPDRFFNVHC